MPKRTNFSGKTLLFGALIANLPKLVQHGKFPNHQSINHNVFIYINYCHIYTRVI